MKLLLAFVLLLLTGCVVNKNESAGSGNSQAPGLGRTLTEAALSWKGLALTGAGGLLATGAVAHRGRRWKKAYHATADVIESHPADAMLKVKCAVAHARAGVYGLTKQQARKYDDKKRNGR